MFVSAQNMGVYQEHTLTMYVVRTFQPEQVLKFPIKFELAIGFLFITFTKLVFHFTTVSAKPENM